MEIIIEYENKEASCKQHVYGHRQFSNGDIKRVFLSFRYNFAQKGELDVNKEELNIGNLQKKFNFAP